MTKFNETIAEQILINYENGLPLKYAAGLVGVNPSTVWRWRKKGEKAKDNRVGATVLLIMEQIPKVAPKIPPAKGPRTMAPTITGICTVVALITGN